VIDALIGSSLRGNPAGRAAELIEGTNRQRAPVLALDTPSGLAVTTGPSRKPVRHSDRHPDVGVAEGRAAGGARAGRPPVPGRHLGPRLVYEQMGIRVGDLFAGGAVVEIGT